MKAMKLIMCGTMVPSEYENKIQYLSNAANRFQLNFVKEMKKECEIRVYSYLGIAVDEQIQTALKQENGDVKVHFRTADRVTGVMRYKRAVKQALKKADCLLTYNVTYAWMFAPALARRLSKKSALILADYSGEESYHSFARRLYGRLQLKVIQKYDVVIGLSETTKRFLKPDQRFLCVEGGIDQDVYDYFGQSSPHEQQQKDGITTYMYAGILEPVTGVDILLKAFSKIDNPSIRLKISGKGSLQKLVEDAAKQDHRISYLGCVPYEEYLSNLKQADVLVNPRNMNLPENENNFPSKIMEYLATGKPIISTRFPGWEKYNEYIVFCESTVDGLQTALETADVGRDRVKEQRKFAAGFLWSNQVKKIHSLLMEKS